MNQEKRRTKGKNFSDVEIGIFLDLIEENVNIIENKKTDALHSKLKNDAWEKITQKFNADNKEERTITQLKNFYDNFKRKTRKDYEDYMAQLYKTGGKKVVNKNLDTLEERLINLLQKHFELDNNIFDSSSYHESRNLYSEDKGLNEINLIEEIDKNEKEDIQEISSVTGVHSNSNIFMEETPKIISKEKEKMPIKKRKTTVADNSLENLTLPKISEETTDIELDKLKAEYAKEKLDKIREENLHLKRKHLLEERKIENEIILQEMQIEQEKIKLALMKKQNSLL